MTLARTVRQTAIRYGAAIPATVGTQALELARDARGTRRGVLLALVANYLLRAHPQTVSYELPGGVLLSGDSEDQIQRYLSAFGFWEPDLSRALGQLLSPNDVFVDVGANVGYYSSLALDLVGPRGLVIAVEPDQDMTGTLRRLADRHPSGSRLRIEPCAVAEREGTVHFRKGPATNRGMGRIESAPGPVAPLLVHTRSLADVVAQHCSDLSRIGAIKIDVEGAELAVLAGGWNVIAQLRIGAGVIVEVRNSRDLDHVTAQFAHLGYRRLDIPNDYRPSAYASATRSGSSLSERRTRSPKRNQAVDTLFVRMNH